MIDSQTIDNLKELFSLANTPGFLSRHLFRDPTVLYLTQKYTQSQLIDELEKQLALDSWTIENHITAYVLLISSIVAGSESERLFRIKYIEKMRWAEDIIKSSRFASPSVPRITLEQKSAFLSSTSSSVNSPVARKIINPKDPI